MKQYHKLLKTIKKKGSYKKAARPGMPGTLSRFGHQFRVDLSKGFPLLTTKQLSFKNIVVELLWFLRGDTNIKYLIDNGCNIWNEDAYNYYLKLKAKHNPTAEPISFELFIEAIKGNLDITDPETLDKDWFPKYKLGDCGFQYGRVWREWQGVSGDILKIKSDNLSEKELEDFRRAWMTHVSSGNALIVDCQLEPEFVGIKVDQLAKVINNIQTKPFDRRKVVTAIDPAHDEDLALYWCHCLFQFNCREIQFTIEEAKNITSVTPKYYLDCQLYQRSCDVFLGVPYNIASYSLLIHLVAKMCNMVPGDFVHTFGDVHIYDNHKEQVDLQLRREFRKLPTVHVLEKHKDHGTHPDHFEKYLTNRITLDEFLKSLTRFDFRLEGYDPHPAIKAELSTGMKKQ